MAAPASNCSTKDRDCLKESIRTASSDALVTLRTWQKEFQLRGRFIFERPIQLLCQTVLQMKKVLEPYSIFAEMFIPKHQRQFDSDVSKFLFAMDYCFWEVETKLNMLRDFAKVAWGDSQLLFIGVVMREVATTILNYNLLCKTSFDEYGEEVVSPPTATLALNIRQAHRGGMNGMGQRQLSMKNIKERLKDRSETAPSRLSPKRKVGSVSANIGKININRPLSARRQSPFSEEESSKRSGKKKHKKKPISSRSIGRGKKRRAKISGFTSMDEAASNRTVGSTGSFRKNKIKKKKKREKKTLTRGKKDTTISAVDIFAAPPSEPPPEVPLQLESPRFTLRFLHEDKVDFLQKRPKPPHVWNIEAVRAVVGNKPYKSGFVDLVMANANKRLWVTVDTANLICYTNKRDVKADKKEPLFNYVLEQMKYIILTPAGNNFHLTITYGEDLKLMLSFEDHYNAIEWALAIDSLRPSSLMLSDVKYSILSARFQASYRGAFIKSSRNPSEEYEEWLYFDGLLNCIKGVTDSDSLSYVWDGEILRPAPENSLFNYGHGVWNGVTAMWSNSSRLGDDSSLLYVWDIKDSTFVHERPKNNWQYDEQQKSMSSDGGKTFWVYEGRVPPCILIFVQLVRLARLGFP